MRIPWDHDSFMQPDSRSSAGRLWWERNKWHYLYTNAISNTYVPTGNADTAYCRYDQHSGQWLYHQLSAKLAKLQES